VDLKKFRDQTFEYSKIWNVQLQNTLRPEIQSVLKAWNVQTGDIEGFEVLSLEDKSEAEKHDSEAKMYLDAVQGKWANLRDQVKACQFTKEEEAKVFKMPEIPQPLPYMKVESLLDHYETRKKAKVAHSEEAVEQSKAPGVEEVSASLEI